jgi:hypothetical protein
MVYHRVCEADINSTDSAIAFFKLRRTQNLKDQHRLLSKQQMKAQIDRPIASCLSHLVANIDQMQFEHKKIVIILKTRRVDGEALGASDKHRQALTPVVATPARQEGSMVEWSKRLKGLIGHRR